METGFPAGKMGRSGADGTANTQCHWAVHISVVRIALCVFCHKNFKNQPDMVESACHLAGGFGVSGHFQLQSEFEVHLGYMRL